MSDILLVESRQHSLTNVDLGLTLRPKGGGGGSWGKGEAKGAGAEGDCRVRPKAWVGAKVKGETGRTGQERRLESLLAFTPSMYASGACRGKSPSLQRSMFC